jgi:DTW domain-containing protein YfiP
VRPTCPRCRRPEVVCYCGDLVPIPTRTRVVILQHPKERKTAIGTARMAHLALANSELLGGVDFSDSRRLLQLAEDPGTVVLYPGEGATDIAALVERPPSTVIVVDGTWPQARKIIRSTPLLQRLPRIAFTPERPSNYRIRKEPAFHCVSTVEAVVEVLGQLEGQREAYRPMLDAFARMVDLQIEAEQVRQGPPRRKLKRSVRPPPIPPALFAEPERVVCLYAEANAHQNGMEQPPELVQLVASRPATGERLELFLRPRRPLWENTAFHLEVPAETLMQGLDLEEGLARWHDFLREGDTLTTWGFFPLKLLAAEGEPEEDVIDARLIAARILKRRPGVVETSAELLGASAPQSMGTGRAGRRLGALVAVVRALQDRALAAVQAGRQVESAPPRALTG